jgi:hypothetical protein
MARPLDKALVLQIFQHVKNRARQLFAKLQHNEAELTGDVPQTPPDEAAADTDLLPSKERPSGTVAKWLDEGRTSGSRHTGAASFRAAGSTMITSNDQLAEVYMNLKNMCVPRLHAFQGSAHKRTQGASRDGHSLHRDRVWLCCDCIRRDRSSLGMNDAPRSGQHA